MTGSAAHVDQHLFPESPQGPHARAKTWGPQGRKGPRRVSSMCDRVWVASSPEAQFPFYATGRTPASLYLMLAPRAKGWGAWRGSGAEA